MSVLVLFDTVQRKSVLYCNTSGRLTCRKERPIPILRHRNWSGVSEYEKKKITLKAKETT